LNTLAILLVSRLVFRIEVRSCGIDLFGIEVQESRLRPRLRMSHCLVGGSDYFGFHFVLQ